MLLDFDVKNLVVWYLIFLHTIDGIFSYSFLINSFLQAAQTLKHICLLCDMEFQLIWTVISFYFFQLPVLLGY
jgi:hypothetical protein